MKPTLGVFGFGQFMQFFTPYLTGEFDVRVYDKKGKANIIKQVGATPVSLQDAGNCDYVLLGYPAGSLKSLIKEIISYIKPGAIIFDICSVKTLPTSLMLKLLPGDCHIIGTHPIFGPQSGKNGITGLKMVLCDIRSAPSIFHDFKAYFSNTLELAVFEMTSEEHDKEMAYIQGITHFIGRALKRIDIPDTPISTKSYDHLRETGELVGYDSLDLFLSIQKDNPFAGEVREKLLKEFENLNETLKKLS